MKVINVKPVSLSAIDKKPKIVSANQETSIYYESLNIPAGQPIGPGLFMIYTYPQQINNVIYVRQ